MSAVVKSVQLFDLSTTGTSTTGTLAAGTNINQCVPFAMATAGPNENDVQSCQLDCWLSGTDTVNVERTQSTDTLNAIVYVVEFTDAVTIQSGTFSMTGTTTTASLTAVVLGDSFCIGYSKAAGANTDDNFMRTHFNSTTQLGFERDASAGTLAGHWFVVESTEFDTQEFEAVYTSNETATSSPSSYVEADTFLIADREYGGTGNGPSEIGCRVEMTGPTQLTYTRGYRTSFVYYDCQLVECNDSAFASQNGNKDMNGLGTQDNVTISTVDLDKAMAHAACHDWGSTGPTITDSNVDMAAVSLEITGTTTLSVVKGQAVPSSGTIVTWQVVEWELVPSNRALFFSRML